MFKLLDDSDVSPRGGTDHSAFLVLQEEGEKEAGLGEDAAALFCHFIPCLLSVSLQQI